MIKRLFRAFFVIDPFWNGPRTGDGRLAEVQARRDALRDTPRGGRGTGKLTLVR